MSVTDWITGTNMDTKMTVFISGYQLGFKFLC